MPVTSLYGRAAAQLLCLITCASVAAGQAKPRTLKSLPVNSNVAVRLTDGSQVFGRMERIDADSLVLIGAGGRQAYPIAAVRELRDAGVAHIRADGTSEYWYPNANTTRLFFGPTGRTLKAGEGYFADHDIFIASASVGLTNRLQFGAGTLLIPNPEFWFVLPKVGIVQSEKLNVSAGALYGGIRSVSGGIAYLVGSYGSTDRSITLGAGQGFSGEQVSGEPVFMLGGETRMSRRTALVTENYFGAGSDDGLLMYGMRFLGDKFTVDLAFMNLARNMVFPGIPYVDFVIKW